MSGVSRHLRILAEAGIVQMRPEGQKRLYSLRKEAFDQLEAWVAGYRRHWEARLDRFGSALERRQAVADTDPQEIKLAAVQADITSDDDHSESKQDLKQFGVTCIYWTRQGQPCGWVI